MAGDLFWNNVSLLTTFDGSNGQTSFSDLSLVNNTLSATGSAAVSTANPKFGTGSVVGPGQVTTPITTSGPLDLSGGGAWTVEGWLRTTNNSDAVMSMGVFGTTNGIRLQVANNNSLQFVVACTGGLAGVGPGTTLTCADGNWHAFAFAFDGTHFGLWIDGISQGTSTLSGLGTIIPFTATVNLNGWQSGQNFTGSVDEVRITKGVSRYTPGVSYTPDTVAFPPFATNPVLPSVVGQTLAQAQATLTAINLGPPIVGQINSGTVQTGLVATMTPAAGTLVTGGSSIQIQVSTGPAPSAGAGGDRWGAGGGGIDATNFQPPIAQVVAQAAQIINAATTVTGRKSVEAAMSDGSLLMSTPASSVPTTPKVG